MKFERFRAYAASQATKSQWFEEENDEGVIVRERRAVDTWATEDVAFEGEPAADGETAVFDAGQTMITRVAVYRGPVESERSVAAVEVGKAGKLSVRCPDRKPKPA